MRRDLVLYMDGMIQNRELFYLLTKLLSSVAFEINDLLFFQLEGHRS